MTLIVPAQHKTITTFLEDELTNKFGKNFELEVSYHTDFIRLWVDSETPEVSSFATLDFLSKLFKTDKINFNRQVILAEDIEYEDWETTFDQDPSDDMIFDCFQCGVLHESS